MFLRIIAAAAGSWIALNIVFWLFCIAVSLTIHMNGTYTTMHPFYRAVLNAAYCVLCFYARISVRVSGIEQIPAGRTFLLISNHRSKFDNMIQSAVLHTHPLSFVSKRENFLIPLARRFMHRCCYISLNRGSIHDAFTMIHSAASLISSGTASIGIYPEGRRSTDGTLLDFKAGCFKIAAEAQCPIVIAAINGTENIHRNFPLRRTRVTLDFIHVYTPEHIAGKKSVEIAQSAHTLIQNHLEDIHGTSA